MCACSAASPQADLPTGVAVQDDGLIATWYAPKRKAPVILTLGGSEGGDKGAQLLGGYAARLGYGALALAYCGMDGLPPAIANIPLEYFTKAIDWIERQPLADRSRIGLWGASVGGETALMVASGDPRITAVVAGVPSSVVWQGFDPTNEEAVEPTYLRRGQPVPFLPYDMSRPFISILDLYQRSLDKAGEHPDAAIAVEKINGPVLLISGAADAMWPSAAMSDQVMARLDTKNFKYPHEHIAYPDAGHVASTPPFEHPALKMLEGLGGTPDGNAAARADAWKRTAAFFKTYLGTP